MKPVEVSRGSGPVVLGLPHTGTMVPPDIWVGLNALGRTLADTDWHVERLYDGLLPDVTVVRATFHRYVIDANRDPDGASLYPGQNTTGLVPLTDFEGEPIWTTSPGAVETETRRSRFHQPYHAALTSEMERVSAAHGVAILLDCHSIRSRIPYLFDGVLPDLNIGTNGGLSCAPGIEKSVSDICFNASGYKAVLNGRFKGGWTTRHYGQPMRNWHAIQMELAQSTYLDAEKAPWEYDSAKAVRIRKILGRILAALTNFAVPVAV